MKYAALAALGLVSVNAFLSDRISEEELMFMKYVTEWNKSYGTKAEFEFRLEQFKNTLKKMAEHNENASGSEVTLNHFADWTHEEYKKLLGYTGPQRNQQTNEKPEVTADEVNWVTKGAVTNVKNQGSCGSCWAFSTTGSVEGAMFLSTGTLQSYSEQQLVDCSKSNAGCNGGWMDTAFQYIEINPLMLEADYPYTARDGTCKYNRTKGVGKVKSYKDVSPDATGAGLKSALQRGPVSVAVEADQTAFQFYHTGVVTKGCGTQLDHGVLAVGYGTLDGQEYFLVKNSWGPSWGDKGYIRIAPDQCGITHAASYPMN